MTLRRAAFSSQDTTMPPSTPLHPSYSVVGDRYTFLLTGAQTAGAYAMFEAYVPVGSGSPPHAHQREDEAFYVIEGEFEFTVAGVPVHLTTGGFLLGQRGVPHNFKNVGSVPGRMIVTVAPAGFEGFFAEIGVLLASRNDAPIPPTPADIQKLIATAPKYGLEIHAPH